MITLEVPTYISSYPLTQQYFIQNGRVIESIQAGSGKPNKLFNLQKLLADYGQPDQVWIDTAYDSDGIPDLALVIAILYSNKGIMALYAIDAEIIGDNVRACPHLLANSSRFGLWAAGKELTFREAAETTHLLGLGVSWFQPVQHVTELNAENFYLRYREEGPQECFETPGIHWE